MLSVAVRAGARGGLIRRPSKRVRLPHPETTDSAINRMTKGRVTPPWYIRRAILVVGIHLVAFLAAYLLAYAEQAFRFDFRFESKEAMAFWFTVPGVLMVKALVFYLTGQYRRSWRSVTFSDLASLIKAATLSMLAIYVLFYVVEQKQILGRAIPLIDWANTILILGGLRAFHRMSREEFRFFYRPSDARKALIVGANQSGHNLRGTYTRPIRRNTSWWASWIPTSTGSDRFTPACRWSARPIRRRRSRSIWTCKKCW